MCSFWFAAATDTSSSAPAENSPRMGPAPTTFWSADRARPENRLGGVGKDMARNAVATILVNEASSQRQKGASLLFQFLRSLAHPNYVYFCVVLRRTVILENFSKRGKTTEIVEFLTLQP